MDKEMLNWENWYIEADTSMLKTDYIDDPFFEPSKGDTPYPIFVTNDEDEILPEKKKDNLARAISVFLIGFVLLLVIFIIAGIFCYSTKGTYENGNITDYQGRLWEENINVDGQQESLLYNTNDQGQSYLYIAIVYDFDGNPEKIKTFTYDPDEGSVDLYHFMVTVSNGDVYLNDLIKFPNRKEYVFSEGDYQLCTIDNIKEEFVYFYENVFEVV